MTGWEIDRIDAKDEARLSVWWHAARATDTGRPYDFWPSWEVARAYYLSDDPNYDTTLLAAYVDGEIAGVARLRYPNKDNQHLVWAAFGVLEPFRRRGLGSALVAAAEEDARDHHRDVLLADVKTPPGEQTGNLAFASRVGFELASMEEHKVLDLAASEHLWPALDVEVAEALGDYRVEVWTEIPDEHVDNYCSLLNVFMSQIPLGDLPLEALQWDRARIRANEARAKEIHMVELTSAAIAPDGTLAGSSDVNFNLRDPRLADIGITLVLPAHRGHRLGLALKLATHQALRARSPETELITTTNANVNEFMNAINDRMGYRVVEQFHELQKKL